MPDRRSDEELRALIEPVARRLLGDPNPHLSTAKLLRWGTNGSLVVDLEKRVSYDHELKEGGGTLWLIGYKQLLDLRGAGQWLDDNFPAGAPLVNGHARPNGHAPSENPIVRFYDYVDAEGRLLSQTGRRANPKKFVQRRPGGPGEKKWEWNLNGVPRVPYRLPELLAAIAADREVWIAEGEKDVDNLIAAGLAATTNVMGAGKWTRDLNAYFRGAAVTVLADNDDPGRDHGHAVAAQLAAEARRVRLLDLGRVWSDCPPKGDASDFLAKHAPADLEALAAELRPYAEVEERQGDDDIEALVLPARPIKDIPPRRWAYGHFLQFGNAAVLAAPDGIGKGFVTTAMVLSVIFGRALLGERIWKTGPVAIITYEDDREEWERRIAAACLFYDLDFATAMANVHFIRHRTEARVVFAQRGEGGGPMRFTESAAIVRELRACKAVMLVVDPFNSAHDLDDGNSNTQIARVAGEINRVAQATGVAAMVLHHVRKGGNGEIDDLMGATSLRATFRGARILWRITPQQAEDLGIKPEDRFRYFRIAGTKENYAPPPEKSHWYKLVSQKLGNDTDDYPDGDDMAVATVWQPPSPFEGVSLPALKRVFDQLRDGPGEGGWCYSAEVRATYWAGDVIIAEAGVSKAQAAAAIATWVESGVVVSLEWRTPKRSRSTRIVLDEAKVANILAPLRQTMPEEEDL